MIGTLILLAAQAAAVPAARPIPLGQPDIVVRARRRDEVEQLVRQMAPARFGYQLARWNTPVCVGVNGLDPTYTAAVRGRVEQLVRSVHLSVVAKTGCRPDIVISFRPDADAFTRALVAQYGDRLFDPNRSGARRDQIAALLAPRPVRMMMLDKTSIADGSPILDDGSDVPTVLRSTPSRIGESTRRDATLSYLIVDEKAVAHVSWRQLADYLALAALSRPDLASRYSGDTILSLFSKAPGVTPPPALTATDTDFLHGLYASDPALSVIGQQSQIANFILHPRPPAKAP